MLRGYEGSPQEDKARLPTKRTRLWTSASRTTRPTSAPSGSTGRSLRRRKARLRSDPPTKYTQKEAFSLSYTSSLNWRAGHPCFDTVGSGRMLLEAGRGRGRGECFAMPSTRDADPE